MKNNINAKEFVFKIKPNSKIEKHNGIFGIICDGFDIVASDKIESKAWLDAALYLAKLIVKTKCKNAIAYTEPTKNGVETCICDYNTDNGVIRERFYQHKDQNQAWFLAALKIQSENEKNDKGLDDKVANAESNTVSAAKILEETVSQCNWLADLRPLFLQIKDSEKLKDACLHFLGDAYQIRNRIDEYEKKFKLSIEMLPRAQSSNLIEYCPLIIMGKYIFIYSYNGKWKNHIYTPSKTVSKCGVYGFNDKTEGYKATIDFIESNLDLFKRCQIENTNQ